VAQASPNKKSSRRDRYTDERSKIVSHDALVNLHEIRGENKNSEPAPHFAFLASPIAANAQATPTITISKINNPTLKAACAPIQSPKRIESTAGNKSSQMVRAHMQAPKAKRVQATSFQWCRAFHQGRSSACSVSGSRRLR